MTGWSFANDSYFMPEPPVSPPDTDFDKYQYQWEYWLDDNYDEKTGTVFGIDFEDNDQLIDKLWDRFMEDVVYDGYDGP